MRVGDNETRIVIVIVDGGSEIKSLGPVLSSLYDNTNPNYIVMFPAMVSDGSKDRGDFTAKNGVNPKNAIRRMNEFYINPLLKQNGLTPDCIGEIIHIIDMDGAYIDDSNIIYEPNRKKYYYSNDGKLLVSNIESAKRRNLMKRRNIDYLYSLDFINNSGCSILYSMYFFSSNLDHVLHGDANMPFGYEKVKRAEEFAKKYEDSPKDFLKAIESMSGTLLNMTYEETWDFIRERGNHSIEPHTNINILLRKIMEK